VNMLMFSSVWKSKNDFMSYTWLQRKFNSSGITIRENVATPRRVHGKLRR